MGSRLYTFHDSLFLAQFSCDIIIGCLPDSPSRSLQLFSVHVPESEKREATEERRELDLASSFYQGVHVERRKEENGGGGLTQEISELIAGYQNGINVYKGL
jgi:hypothetical protein